MATRKSMQDIANDLKALREKHNKTQKEMAEIFRVSPKVYGNWERGATVLPIDAACPLLEEFGVNIYELLYEGEVSVGAHINELRMAKDLMEVVNRYTNRAFSGSKNGKRNNESKTWTRSPRLGDEISTFHGKLKKKFFATKKASPKPGHEVQDFK